MKKKAALLYIFCVLLTVSGLYIFLIKNNYSKKGKKKMIKDLLPWFNHIIRSSEDVDCIKNYVLEAYQDLIDSIIKYKDIAVVPDNVSQLFIETYYKIDRVMFDISLQLNYYSYYNLLGSDDKIKQKIQSALSDINTFVSNNYTYNYDIYIILKNIGELYLQQNIEPDEATLITKNLEDYKRIGIHLSDEKKDILKEKRILLDDLCLKFSLNIQSTDNHVIVERNDLTGLSDEQIKKLKKTDEGKYKLGIDYPTYNMIMSYCQNRDIRKKLYYEFNTVAYPVNYDLLEEIRLLRNDIAILLGFQDYASFDIADSMAGSINNVEKLIKDVYQASLEKAKNEREVIIDFAKNDLFKLSKESNKDSEFIIEAWDIPFIYQAYENKYFHIDQEEVAQYFSVRKTIEKLLKIYCQFFDINIDFIDYSNNDWKYDSLMQVLRVTEKNGDIIGDIILDLYPRSGKYSHACKASLIPAVYCNRERSILREIPLCVIVANFNQPNEYRDGLLYFNEVKTFFHEFGHALHSLFGVTRYASQAGTNVYADFVEIPSQLFEYWLLEKNIIYDLSEHYKTGEKLSSEVIDQILHSEFFGKGLFYQRQLRLTKTSLNLFLKKFQKDSLEKIVDDIDKEFIRLSDQPTVSYYLASFGHLASDLYGAKYYSYLWSLLYAVDFFYYIKDKNGLFDPIIGKKLREKVLSKGGSVELSSLIVNFLEREPDNKNFYKLLNRYLF